MKTTQYNSEREKTYEEYINHLATKRTSKNTLINYRQDLQSFAKWFLETTGEDLSPVRVTSIDLREYQGHLRRLGRKPATINRHLQTIRNWLSWCVKERLISRIPDYPKRVQEIQKAPQALTRKETNRLLRSLEQEANPRDVALVRLMLSCGLRISETVQLKIEDITLNKRSGNIIVRSGKGEKWREVPIPPETRKALNRWLTEQGNPKKGWLFPGREGALTTNAAWRIIKKYAWKAQIDLHPHTLRHACATNMVQTGTRLEVVASILGHSRLDTTNIYTKPSANDMADALTKGEL